MIVTARLPSSFIDATKAHSKLVRKELFLICIFALSSNDIGDIAVLALLQDAYYHSSASNLRAILLVRRGNFVGPARNPENLGTVQFAPLVSVREASSEKLAAERTVHLIPVFSCCCA